MVEGKNGLELVNQEKYCSIDAEDGILTVNNGKPAVGRRQLAETAQSYMEAFPDIELTMDSLTSENVDYRYYGLLKGRVWTWGNWKQS